MGVRKPDIDVGSFSNLDRGFSPRVRESGSGSPFCETDSSCSALDYNDMYAVSNQMIYIGQHSM